MSAKHVHGYLRLQYSVALLRSTVGDGTIAPNGALRCEAGAMLSLAYDNQRGTLALSWPLKTISARSGAVLNSMVQRLQESHFPKRFREPIWASRLLPVCAIRVVPRKYARWRRLWRAARRQVHFRRNSKKRRKIRPQSHSALRKMVPSCP